MVTGIFNTCVFFFFLQSRDFQQFGLTTLSWGKIQFLTDQFYMVWGIRPVYIIKYWLRNTGQTSNYHHHLKFYTHFQHSARLNHFSHTSIISPKNMRVYDNHLVTKNLIPKSSFTLFQSLLHPKGGVFAQEMSPSSKLLVPLRRRILLAYNSPTTAKPPLPSARAIFIPLPDLLVSINGVKSR